MPGAKGSGGRREGAGRKPRSFTLKAGDRLALTQRTPEGPLSAGAMIEVTEITRSYVKLLVVSSNGGTEGDTLTLIR